MVVLLNQMRRRKSHLVLLLAVGVVCLVATYEFVYRTDRREFARETSRPPDFPSYFTDYSTYSNYSGPLRIPKPIEDPDGFAALIDEPDLCERRRPEARIVYYVHTAPWHSAQRELIRQAWGSDKFYRRLQMVTVFFVGRTRTSSVQEFLLEESARHHDIVQMDYDDGYYNLTYKSITALNWIQKHCPRAEYVLKTDDDVFVNVFQFVRHLRDVRNASEDLVYCHVHFHMDPHRNPKSKWFVTQDEYPWPHYPDFCAGMVVYFRARLIPRLLNATRLVPYLKLDDVYLTGLLRNKSNVQLRDMSHEINVFEGHFCEKGGNQPQLFCQIAGIQRRWDVWINLLLSEIARLAKNNKVRRQRYVASIYDIIYKDLDGFL